MTSRMPSENSQEGEQRPLTLYSDIRIRIRVKVINIVLQDPV